jgi:hypothetical protein
VIIDVGIVQVLGTRVAVAFVDSAFVRPGPGDTLLHEIFQRLRHLTHAPLMLYSDDGRGYAPFQTHEFAKRIRRAYVADWLKIDLDTPWHVYQPEPEF